MTKSKRVMRRLILSRLYDCLSDHYSVLLPREPFLGGETSLHELDALLAFKSDPQLEELRNALERLEAGTYGICISCKSMISQSILDRDPAQRICDICEEKFILTASPVYLHGHMTA